jgi:hypothetical protein
LLIGFIGMADTGPLKVFEYVAMGFTMDVLSVVFRMYLTNVAVGFVLGSLGSFAKLIVNYSITGAIVTNANVILVGIGVAGATHLIFGGAGGVISSIVLSRIQHVKLPRRILDKKKTET